MAVSLGERVCRTDSREVQAPVPAERGRHGGKPKHPIGREAFEIDVPHPLAVSPDGVVSLAENCQGKQGRGFQRIAGPDSEIAGSRGAPQRRARRPEMRTAEEVAL